MSDNIIHTKVTGAHHMSEFMTSRRRLTILDLVGMSATKRAGRLKTIDSLGNVRSSI